MVARGKKSITLDVNRKLAPHGKVVCKTRWDKVPPPADREYQLLNCREGTKRDLSLNEVWHLARELGVLTID
jgi:hypothetical protein